MKICLGFATRVSRYVSLGVLMLVVSDVEFSSSNGFGVSPFLTSTVAANDRDSQTSAKMDWENLPGVDGEKHSLNDFKESDVVVVVFTCNHCPIAKAYDERLNAFQKTFAAENKGESPRVSLVAISVSLEESDGMEEMKERAKTAGFKFPYLQDLTQKTGRRFGAKATPHVFVLNKKRQIVYQGAFDDNMFANKVKTEYVAEVVSALLAGKPAPHTKTRTVGCGISYDPTLR